MLITNYEKWSVTDSGEKEIKLVNNANGNRVVSVMYLNPDADCTVAVTGFVDEDGTELKAVDIANLAKVDSVTEAGTYMYIVEPYAKVKIEVTGTADIGIKLLY